MENDSKKAAAEYKTNSKGATHLVGHWAVDPNGHICRLPGDMDLPDPGWRWATAADQEHAAAAEAERRTIEAANAEASAAERRASVEAEPKTGGPLKE